MRKGFKLVLSIYTAFAGITSVIILLEDITNEAIHHSLLISAKWLLIALTFIPSLAFHFKTYRLPEPEPPAGSNALDIDFTRNEGPEHQENIGKWLWTCNATFLLLSTLHILMLLSISFLKIYISPSGFSSLFIIRCVTLAILIVGLKDAAIWRKYVFARSAEPK